MQKNWRDDSEQGLLSSSKDELRKVWDGKKCVETIISTGYF